MGLFQSRRIAGKSGCLTDEEDLSPMPNVNTGDTYYNYKMLMLTSFFVHATISV